MEKNMLENIWPEWEIVREIGRGTFGVVYEAVRHDHQVESRAAIKTISIPQNTSEIDSLRSEGLSEDASRTYFRGVVDDFVSEIQLMESFKGVQNIVSVEDFKVVEKQEGIGWDIFIRMELLTPFNGYICDRTMTEREVVKLGVDICNALELCAKRNVIHRDIKPENIFINEFGDFKLGDFGIARKLENVTGGLSQKGTYNYMAPEIEKGTQYDATVDIYSLGLVLYRMMNKNRLPFLDTEKQLINPNERAAAIRRRMDGEALPAPCDASPALAAVILCACSANPRKRFATATAMKNALINTIGEGQDDEIRKRNLVQQDLLRGSAELYSNVDTHEDSDETKHLFYNREPRENNATLSLEPEIIPQPETVDVVQVELAPEQQLDAEWSVDPPADLPVKERKEIKTFGKKKKSALPKIIVAIFLILLMAGGAVFFVLPKFLNVEIDDIVEGISEVAAGKKEKDEAKQADSVYTAYDEEQMTAILEEAAVLAEKKDYEGALAKVKSGAATYPKAEVWAEKEKEYGEALATYVKSETLAQAAGLAAAGDYSAAISLIQLAQERDGEDADYQKAEENYIEAYKDQIISAADGHAAEGDFLAAIQEIKNTSNALGGDLDLAAKAQAYEKSYIDNALSTADKCLEEMDYTGAEAAVSAALKIFPRSQELLDEQGKIARRKPQYLLSVCPPYQTSNYDDGSRFMTMGGEDYTNGFVMAYWSGGFAYFNLKEEYRSLEFDIGHIDGAGMQGKKMMIYLDDELAAVYELSANSMVQHQVVDISGASQMRIEWESGPEYGVANVMVVGNPD